jgi:hypothetical protein
VVDDFGGPGVDGAAHVVAKALTTSMQFNRRWQRVRRVGRLDDGRTIGAAGRPRIRHGQSLRHSVIRPLTVQPAVA